MTNNNTRTSRKWYANDLHLHTPASSDYQERDVTNLQILQQAEARGLDMVAYTDHNTVAGYRKMKEEIDQLQMLKDMKRILPEEDASLIEYQRLLGKITVLPGFEFTATFGFHILGVFPPEKPVRDIEHLLLDLNVPSDQLDEGSATIGASADVLRAYQVINDAGGMVIAAHANSSNGVAMRGFSFGGQTKIAYTQDPNLIALEVTDLENYGRRKTASFFNGSKPEYPRRMHCIQGSDAHRMVTDSKRKKNLGIGDRATDVLVHENTFEALRELFQGNDFSRTRPHQKKKGGDEFDFLKSALEEGSNIVQEFHEGMTARGGKLIAVISDVCAFANTIGGTIYIGASNDSSQSPVGISNPANAIKQLEKEISNRISPPLTCTVNSQKSGNKDIIQVIIPRGDDPPYAVDDNKIFVRAEAETGLAVRDEIVSLVQRGKSVPVVIPTKPEVTQVAPAKKSKKIGKLSKPKDGIQPPRTGVEVTSVTERSGVAYYSVKDLRNGNQVKNVTEKSARRLWHYAIMNYAKLPAETKRPKAEWQGNIGLINTSKQGKSQRYDLVRKQGNVYRYYFGVTEDGIHGSWRKLVGLDTEDD